MDFFSLWIIINLLAIYYFYFLNICWYSQRGHTALPFFCSCVSSDFHGSADVIMAADEVLSFQEK